MAKAKKKPPAKRAAKSKPKARAKALAKPVRKATAAKSKTKPKPQKSPPQRAAPPPKPTPAAPAQPLDDLDSLRNALGDILDDADMLAEPSIDDAGGRDAIHVELGAKLSETRGDLQQERAVIDAAIDSFMRLAIAKGLAPDASAYTAQCPEFFWEGDGANPPVYARVPDATHEEIGRWFQMIVEGVRAYDSRVGAVSTAPS